MSRFQRYKYFRFWQPHCHFRLSVVDAIFGNTIGARNGDNATFAVGISTLSVCRNSRDTSISGFGGHIAISGCRLLLQSLAKAFFDSVVKILKQVENLSFVVSEILLFPVSAVISGCRSLLESSKDTFFEL